jgi:hypothetical protein
MGFEPMISAVTGQRIKPDYANEPIKKLMKENWDSFDGIEPLVFFLIKNAHLGRVVTILLTIHHCANGGIRTHVLPFMSRVRFVISPYVHFCFV